MAEAARPPSPTGDAALPPQAQPTSPGATAPGDAAGFEGLEAEDDDYDSAYGDGGESILNSTTSIASSIMKYREENGRTYHAYKDGSYTFPNDEEEQDRLDLQYHLFQLIFEGKLFTAPVPKDKILHRVLDVGTGTGIWAIDFGDEHPESSVLGVDLSPIQPQFAPPNVEFQIDDLEAPWTFSNKFDLIYGRNMMGSFDNYPRFFEQAFANLNPGGFVELVDPTWPIKLNDGEWPEDSALYKWALLWAEAMAKMGRQADGPRYYKEQMIAAGFINVTETIHIIPNNRWPKDKRLKEIGMWQTENFKTGGESLSLAMFTRILGWTKQELQIFMAQVKAEYRNPRIHSYFEYIAVVGQKP
ncbi:methyltransferase domain-containing protein [Drepanopeziza brunnea f. sp. 'multigermtubi' MB_m1]|uniref:Methyltransferase domain-containing protein n=1 Tax=Marssonina brunnea f. sp. multigermtubi (strain MB_m1) TaxID=1072389 RepID=K1X7W9_MARBU|nr:methyltransferase domain-containing protein [Drepanopeziza brunnea f. sp. 'multigermtubi' MB_m1]EKD21152.1 methyltransferase domain-containing protein [Drepanopeziza brunnea f. sp. 'multigermtubi' MB_m1]